MSEPAPDHARWRQVAIGLYGRVAVYPLHGQRTVYVAQLDLEARTLELTPRDDGEPMVLHYDDREAGVLSTTARRCAASTKVRSCWSIAAFIGSTRSR